MREFGIIGSCLSHSFSKEYFSKKFRNNSIKNCSYENFELKNCKNLNSFLLKKENLVGLNVTTPFKIEIIKYLDHLNKVAKHVGAVNTIKINKRTHKTRGFNTDIIGFEKSILPLLKKHHRKALILGSGGASKAIIYVLKKHNIKQQIVSRKEKLSYLTYKNISEKIIKEYYLIINCTPLGSGNFSNKKPKIPYNALTKKHLVYDLNYNPKKTLFLLEAEKKKAEIKNGLEMLIIQAEKSWEIWNR